MCGECREESKNSYECREELAREEAKEREEERTRGQALGDALPLLVGIAEADRARLIGVGEDDRSLRRWRRDATRRVHGPYPYSSLPKTIR